MTVDIHSGDQLSAWAQSLASPHLADQSCCPNATPRVSSGPANFRHNASGYPPS